MNLPTVYSVGTLTLVHGETAAVGHGTKFLSRVQAGDTVWTPTPGVDCRIADVIDDEHLTLAFGWPGEDQVEGPYEVRFQGDMNRALETQAQVLEMLRAGRYGRPNAVVRALAGRDAYDDVDPADYENGLFFVWVLQPAPFRIWVKASAAHGDWEGPTSVQGADGDITPEIEAALVAIGEAMALYEDLTAVNAAAIATAESADAAAGSAGLAAGSAEEAAVYAAAAKRTALYFVWSTATADADPGDGVVQVNNASPAIATAMYIDELDANGSDASAWIDSFDDSTNVARRGVITLIDAGDVANWIKYRVAGVVTTAAGYRKIAIAHVASAGVLTSGRPFSLDFAPAGNRGVDGDGAGNVNTDGEEVVTGNFVLYPSTDPNVIADSGVPFDDVSRVGHGHEIADIDGLELALEAAGATVPPVRFVVGTPSGDYDGSLTVFPIDHTPGYEFVVINGSVLSPSDYGSDGTEAIVLTDAAIEGQVITILSLQSVQVGLDGADAFVYIAYASDDEGAGFTPVFDPALAYIGIIQSATEIPVLAESDFEGLWTRYRGTNGVSPSLSIGLVVTGAPGEPAEAAITGVFPDLELNLLIPQGAGGTPGAAATIEVGEVTSGAIAAVENTGTLQEAVFDFVLPQGEPGAAATIEIGDVTTGLPGSPASVTNSGTDAAAVFDFVIPAGADGSGAVDSVNGVAPVSGDVTIDADDIDDGATDHKFATAAQLALVGTAVQPGALGTAAAVDIDIDGTLAANSDAKVATQKAVKTAIAAALATLLDSPPGALDTLNELAAALGDDPNFATTVTGALAAKLASASNLSDLANAATARENLGLSANGSSLVTAANYAAMKTLLAVALADITDMHANGRSLVAANYAAMRGLLNLEAGTDFYSISAANALLDAKADIAPNAPNAQTGTTYTAVLADATRPTTLSNAGAIALTIPTNASVAFAEGTVLTFFVIGAGQVTVAGAGGVTVNSRGGRTKSAGPHAAFSLTKRATNTWQLYGDLVT